MSIDFKGYIKKAKLYPDKETWKAEDPDSYDVVEKQNVMDRPEISRHMDVEARSGIKIEDAIADSARYKTYTKWRESSPVIYWAAHENEWLSDERITSHLGPFRKRWTLHNVRKEAAKYSTQAEWAQKGPESFKAAKRNLWHVNPLVIEHMEESSFGEDSPFQPIMDNGKLLIGPNDIEKFPDSSALRQYLNDLSESDGAARVYKLAEDLFVKPDIIVHSPQLVQTYIVEALIREQKWEIHPSCETLAHELGLPHNARWRGCFESPDREAIFDLTQIHGMKRKASHITIRKVKPFRLVAVNTKAGKILRALTAVPKKRMRAFTKEIFDDLSEDLLVEIKAAQHDCSKDLKASINAYFS